MRIRSIKPEFWRSTDISALPLADRLLFIGLWSYVDDSGVGIDKLSHICADLFAADLEANPTEVFGRVRGGLDKLFEHGLITRYTVDSVAYIYITNWGKHQRIDKPSRTRYPMPGMGIVGTPELVREGSGSRPEVFAPGTEEQRNRGTEEQRNSNPHPQASEVATIPALGFTDFWEVWGKRVAKTDAEKAWVRAIKVAPPELIIEKARALFESPTRPEMRFIPYAATWLNGRRWEDAEVVASSLPSVDASLSSRSKGHLALVEQLSAEEKGLGL